MSHGLFIHDPADGHLGCFNYGVLGGVTMNILSYSFFEKEFSHFLLAICFFSRYKPGGEKLGSPQPPPLLPAADGPGNGVSIQVPHNGSAVGPQGCASSCSTASSQPLLIVLPAKPLLCAPREDSHPLLPGAREDRASQQPHFSHQETYFPSSLWETWRESRLGVHRRTGAVGRGPSSPFLPAAQ